MDSILQSLIQSFMKGAGELPNDILIGLTEKVFYCEKAFTQSLGNSAIMDFDKVYQLFFDFAIALIILKFIYKGFNIYIGWTDGDKDSDPANYLMNFARAIITALGFKFLYGVLVDIVTEFMDSALLSLLSLEENQNLAELIINFAGNAIFGVIVGLVLVICYCILWLKFLILGIEMLMLRIAFPLACIGLLDSDKGMFTPYLKKLLIICITAVIQIFLLRLSLILVGAGHLIWGIAMCFASMKTPKSLQEFMFAYGNGGGLVNSAVNTGYHISQLVKMVKKG